MAEKKTFVVNVGSLNLREKPDKNANIIRVLVAGEKVTKVSDAPDGWLAVKDGYVMKEFLTQN